MNLDLRRSAELLHVMAHPIRLAILNNLKEGPRCVSDINELLDISQPNLSQHLAVLRREGIINYHEKGKKRCYYIALPSLIQGLMSLLSEEFAVADPPSEVVCGIPDNKTEGAIK